MSLYRNLLSQALKITWRNKYLWFFGFFAALIGNGGQFELLMNGLNGEIGKSVVSSWESIKETGILSKDTFSNLIGIAKEDAVSLIIVLIISLIILAIGAFLIWLSTVSQAALVNNTPAHIGNKKGNFKMGITAGINKFWPVFGLNVVLRLAIVAILFAVGTPVIFLTSKLGPVLSGLIYVIIFAALIIAALAISFIIKYAIGFVVIEENRFFESIRSGWELFKENWLVSMEMAIILFLIGLGVSIAYLFAALILFTPFLLLGFILSKITALGYLIILTIAFVVYLGALFFVGATLSTFQTVSWTTLFTQLLNKGGTSKIVRVVSGLVK